MKMFEFQTNPHPADSKGEYILIQLVKFGALHHLLQILTNSPLFSMLVRFIKPNFFLILIMLCTRKSELSSLQNLVQGNKAQMQCGLWRLGSDPARPTLESLCKLDPSHDLGEPIW